MILAAVFGLFNNPYAGLVVFVALPALFVFGLLLIPVGIWLQRRALLRDPIGSRPTGRSWTCASSGCAARRWSSSR